MQGGPVTGVDELVGGEPDDVGHRVTEEVGDAGGDPLDGAVADQQDDVGGVGDHRLEAAPVGVAVRHVPPGEHEAVADGTGPHVVAVERSLVEERRVGVLVDAQRCPRVEHVPDHGDQACPELAGEDGGRPPAHQFLTGHRHRVGGGAVGRHDHEVVDAPLAVADRVPEDVGVGDGLDDGVEPGIGRSGRRPHTRSALHPGGTDPVGCRRTQLGHRSSIGQETPVPKGRSALFTTQGCCSRSALW